jgi:zinc protease
MIPVIQEARLRNGIRLLLVERTALPLVHLSFVFRTGANADPAGKSGLATLAADALDAGTHSRSLAGIAETFDFAGAYYQSSVTHDGTVFSVSTLTSHLENMAGMMADLLRHASYPSTEVERIRKQRLTSFLQNKDRPARIAGSVFFRTVFGDAHPYGTESEGNELSLALIEHRDVASFNAAHYTPDQLLVVCVGDLSMVELGRLIEREFGGWTGSATSAAPAFPAPPALSPEVLIVDRPGSVQSEIRMGRVAIRRNSPDYQPALVLNRILGGQFNSRLNANLRERRGLTYGAWSSFQAYRWDGPFMAGGAFHTEKTDEALREMIAELERMRESGITAEEHAFAVESLAGAYALAFETSGQVSLALQVRELYDMPADTFVTYLARLRAVTRDDVLRVARLFLDPGTMTTVIVGDAAAILPSVQRTVPVPVGLASPDGSILTPPSSR